MNIEKNHPQAAFFDIQGLIIGQAVLCLHLSSKN